MHEKHNIVDKYYHILRIFTILPSWILGIIVQVQIKVSFLVKSFVTKWKHILFFHFVHISLLIHTSFIMLKWHSRVKNCWPTCNLISQWTNLSWVVECGCGFEMVNKKLPKALVFNCIKISHSRYARNDVKNLPFMITITFQGGPCNDIISPNTFQFWFTNL